METDLITLLFEGGTVIATLALAIFLSFQLRLQHKESTIAAQGELTSSLAEITRDVYNSNELTDIYLRGIVNYEALDENEKHRFNILLWTYYMHIQQMWETDVKAEKVNVYTKIMINSGVGVSDWWSKMGRFVYPNEFVLYIDSIIDEVRIAGK